MYFSKKVEEYSVQEHNLSLLTASSLISFKTVMMDKLVLEQETLHSLLSTAWFQEQIRECFYNLTAFYTLRLKEIQYKLNQIIIDE